MAIEETQTCVSLYSVLEHIVGDPDCPDAERWDQALKCLVAAVRGGKLKVSGFQVGSEVWETIPQKSFAEVAHNPLALLGVDPEDENQIFQDMLNTQYSGKKILEFDEELKANVLKSSFSGPPALRWSDVCADSGAEILKIWPLKLPVDEKLKEFLLEAKTKQFAEKGTPLQQRKAKALAAPLGKTHAEIIAALKAIQDTPGPGPYKGAKREKSGLNQTAAATLSKK
jgi:hypothetical protein